MPMREDSSRPRTSKEATLSRPAKVESVCVRASASHSIVLSVGAVRVERRIVSVRLNTGPAAGSTLRSVVCSKPRPPGLDTSRWLVKAAAKPRRGSALGVATLRIPDGAVVVVTNARSRARVVTRPAASVRLRTSASPPGRSTP
jgi:hypothetical protein